LAFGAALLVVSRVCLRGALREAGRRVDAADYADEVVSLLTDPGALAAKSAASRALAARHTWDAVVERWDALLGHLLGVKNADLLAPAA
jgi:hypothetical protein